MGWDLGHLVEDLVYKAHDPQLQLEQLSHEHVQLYRFAQLIQQEPWDHLRRELPVTDI